MKARRVVILAIVVSIMVAAVSWFLSSDSGPQHPAAAPGVSILGVGLKDAAPKPDLPVTVVSRERPPAVTPAPAPSRVPTITENERKIDEVLRLYPGNTDQDHTSTAQALINLLPSLTKEGQVECAQHISNLLADKEYNRVLHIWRNPGANREVIEVLGTDLMNRDHKVMLPAMLDALRQPSHPFHEEAKNNLQIFLDGDYGNDFGKWDAAMKAFLAREEETRRAASR